MERSIVHQKIKIAHAVFMLAIFVPVMLGAFPQFISAEATVNINGLGVSVGDAGAGDTPQTSQDYLKELYNFLLGFVGVAAMGSIVYGGVLYIISAGNPSRVGEAKTAIWNGIIGLLVAAFGYLILITINPALVKGFDLQTIITENLNNAQQEQ